MKNDPPKFYSRENMLSEAACRITNLVKSRAKNLGAVISVDDAMNFHGDVQGVLSDLSRWLDPDAGGQSMEEAAANNFGLTADDL